MTAAGRRIVWGGSLLALAFDVLLRIVPLIPPVPRMTAHRLVLVAVMVGVPLLQIGLAEAARRLPAWRWVLIPVSGAWLAAVVVLLFEPGILLLASGGLWIAGALDGPKPAR